MICYHCNQIIQYGGNVEWIADEEYSLADTIQVFHLGCGYVEWDDTYDFDHWLPLENLENYLGIAMEMEWDNQDEALIQFETIIDNINMRYNDNENHRT